MVGYDFDKTIYKRDSSTDFFKYMIFSRPYLLIFAPWFLIVFMLYGLKILSKKTTKECLFFFVPWYRKNIDKIVDKFWSKRANGIKEWYAKQKKEDDVIISASLGFILKPIMDTLNITNWIATNYSVKTGKIYGNNCYGEEKVVQYNKMFAGKQLDAFYSDSLSDLPMMRISKQAILVDGDNLKEINIEEYK